mmetsp:Transcript_5478/g.8544  ORF Transcript_5478/g.8544 Transcript_5478/m.8544 type:complete len:122 (+) Transcript_5478:975-1340(+)
MKKTGSTLVMQLEILASAESKTAACSLCASFKKKMKKAESNLGKAIREIEKLKAIGSSTNSNLLSNKPGLLPFFKTKSPVFSKKLPAISSLATSFVTESERSSQAFESKSVTKDDIEKSSP